MGLKNDGFYMDLNRHVVDLTKKNTIERIKSSRVYNCGAYGVFRTLMSNLIRGGWRDRDGFPLKSKFFEKGKLACSISIRRLIKMTGIPNQRMQEYLKMLKEVRWIETSNRYMAKKQTTFILGYWVEYIDTDEKKHYKETWYKDEVMDGIRLLNDTKKVATIEEETTKFEEETISFDEIYFNDTVSYFATP